MPRWRGGRSIDLGSRPTRPIPWACSESTDQGLTWTLQTPHNAGIPPGVGMPLNTQGGYSFHMAVDPASPGDGINDIIYFGAVGQARSTDSGLTFTALSGTARRHACVGVRAAAGSLLRSSIAAMTAGSIKGTGGTAFTSLNGGGLQTALFYNLDVKRDATASVTLGALQDNGIVTNAPPPPSRPGRMGSAATVSTSRTTGRTRRRSTAGATRHLRLDKRREQLRQTSRRHGRRRKSGVYLSAVAVDPSTDGSVYASSNANLWQSTDSGATWPKKVPIPGTANEVDVAPTNNNNVVVAVGGRVLVSTNALGAFTLNNITRNLPGRFVARVAFDPNDPATIYAVLGGFSGFPGGHVFRTTLAGTTWTDISPPLDLPFNAIALDGSGRRRRSMPARISAYCVRSMAAPTGACSTICTSRERPCSNWSSTRASCGRRRSGAACFPSSSRRGRLIAVSLSGNLAFGTVCRGSTQTRRSPSTTWA